ncbi:Flp pilus assembly protein CpaB [Kocuria sp. M1R5S2]|uniref:Flp pilus assembly protein CpaB n=1 Tax=Kocuria rhizosphaerae TaxID=3376285 RepID=UPI0037B3524B
MKIRLIAAGVMALLAVVGLVLVVNYVNTAEARALEGQKPKEVYLVTKQVPEGTPVEELDQYLDGQVVPAVTVPEDYVYDLGEHAGKVAAVTLQPGEQLLASRLVEPIALEEPGTVPVPKGMREVTFTAGPDRVVGGQLKAGDRIGMIVTFPGEEDDPARSELEFRDMLITALQGAAPATDAAAAEGSAEGSEGAGAEAPPVPEGSLLITVAVTAADAEKVVYANEFGSVWLTKETKDSDGAADGATMEDFR